jgi:peptidyl-tRNA hydrolase
VQAAHAAIDFQHQHPVEALQWNKFSNYLVFLTVENEDDLIKLITKADLLGIKHTVFREPDIGNQITAVAFEPSDASRKLTSSCPLLGKEVCNG